MRRGSILCVLAPLAAAALASSSDSTSCITPPPDISASAAADSYRPIRDVVVVGGTHGNEYTGVWVIKSLARKIDHLSSRYPSLNIDTLLAHPEAHLKNKRFIDTDLNRQFSEENLLGEEGLPLTVEGLRAQEVNELLGPKFGEDHPTTDVVIDLHSTTSNMGVCLIVPEGDIEMARAAAYVAHKCGGEEEETRVLVHSIPDRKHRPTLGSIARHGFTVEVGPVPQGVLRHDAVERTEEAVGSFLEYLERRNREPESLDDDLRSWYVSGRVPVYRSAKALEPGQLSGRIRWESDPENPNFPAFLVHKSLQDRDFHKLRTGQPLFVDLDGNTISYNGSHGDEVYLIFVNEGGYYYESSGTGIGVAIKAELGLDDGLLNI